MTLWACKRGEQNVFSSSAVTCSTAAKALVQSLNMSDDYERMESAKQAPASGCDALG